MIIQEKDFILNYCSGSNWDLELLRKVKPKGKPEREEFKVEGYGMPLERCIKIIINYRLENKKEEYTLKEYLNEYNKILSEVKELFKEF